MEKKEVRGYPRRKMQKNNGKEKINQKSRIVTLNFRKRRVKYTIKLKLKRRRSQIL